MSLHASFARAQLYPQVESLFKELNALIQPEKCVDKRKVKKKVYKLQMKVFLEEMEAWLKKARDLLQLSKLKWCEVFYMRMQVCRDSIKEVQLQRYQNFLHAYLKQFPDPQRFCPLWEVASSLDRFLSSHSMDPDSCLVGMPPHPSVISKFSFYLDNQNQSIDYLTETCQENLSRSIISWSKMDDLEHMAR